MTKGNPSIASIGGVIQDHKGKLVAGYAGGIGLHSSMIAEASALLKGLHIVVSLGIENLHIEGDSKSIIDAINCDRLLEWNTKDILLDIRVLVSKLKLNVASHIYREGNQVADTLANFSTHWKLFKC